MSHGMLMTTLPSQDAARDIARALVEERLAACVQLLPIESIYRWDAKVQQEPEVLLLAKTRAALFEAAAARIKALHPYTVPEIVTLPFSDGAESYFQWMDAATDAGI